MAENKCKARAADAGVITDREAKHPQTERREKMGNGRKT